MLRLPLAATLFAFSLAACGPGGSSGSSGDGIDVSDTSPPGDMNVETDTSSSDLGPDTDPACEGPREALGARSGAILGGTNRWTDEVLPLNDAQALAVGGVFTRNDGLDELSCTGTLIAPRVMLTAAHCLMVSPQRILGPGSVRFGVGPDLATPVATFAASEVHLHPDYSYWSDEADNDVAIVVLAEDAVQALDGAIAPVPVNCDPLVRAGFVNERLQVVGYGATDRFGNVFGTKQLWAVETIVDLSSSDFTVDGGGGAGVCYGDSGGPAMFLLDGTIKVVGVLSLGDAICGRQDFFVRVDNECAFLETHLPTCDPRTSAGTCVGNVAEYCASGVTVKDDCATRGEVCATNASGDARCEPAPDRCNGETFAGRCDGATVIWCEAGAIQRRDCGACGTTCGTDAPSGTVDCR
jgi:hypothetical protein